MNETQPLFEDMGLTTHPITPSYFPLATARCLTKYQSLLAQGHGHFAMHPRVAPPTTRRILATVDGSLLDISSLTGHTAP